MISDEEKQKIKAEIVEKINSVMEKNGESFRLDIAPDASSGEDMALLRGIVTFT